MAAVAAAAGTALITGTAFAGGNCDDDCGGSSHHSRVDHDSHHGCGSDCDDHSNSRCNNECHDSDSSDCDDSCSGTDVEGDYYRNYRGARAHEGGNGGRGGNTSAKCLVPVGLSAGAVASSGGEVDQCNSSGGNGGDGGAGDVGIQGNH